MENLHVPNWQVFCFKTIKKPFVSSLWFSLLVYTIWNPSEVLPTLLGLAFLSLSFTSVRLYFAILSPIPMIATVILSFSVHNNTVRTIIVIFAIIWSVLYIIGMYVWRNIATKRYVLSPVSNILIYNPSDFLNPSKKR